MGRLQESLFSKTILPGFPQRPASSTPGDKNENFRLFEGNRNGKTTMLKAPLYETGVPAFRRVCPGVDCGKIGDARRFSHKHTVKEKL
jgi:hypothetical protein